MANEVAKLQSGLSGEPQIATFAIEAPQSPRAIGDQQCDLHSRAGENLCCPGARNPPRRTSGTVEFVAKPQLSDIKPKVWEPRSPPVQRLRPYFSPNLHPILGVPVRRLWK